MLRWRARNRPPNAVRLAAAWGALITSCAWVSAAGQTPVEHASAPRIWVEGEASESSDFPPGTELRKLESPAFSGGAAVGAFVSEPAAACSATWKFHCRESGEYEFWCRLGWRHWNDFEWRLGGGTWNVLTATGGNYEFIKFPLGNAEGVASWVCIGKVKLDAGEHALSVRLATKPGQQRAQQHFDCFVFSRTPFVPAGSRKPGDTALPHPLADGIATADWWPFQPHHPEGETPVLDFSELLEPIGKHGPLEARGDDLAFADGTPVRLWGNNISYHGGQLIYMERHDADRLAGHLAGLGVNLLRVHVLHCVNSLLDMSDGTTRRIDPAKLDRLMYLLAALEKRDIYVCFDLVYHRYFLDGDGVGPELVMPPGGGASEPGYNISWACGAAAFWHPRAIELNMELFRAVLRAENPYTGRRMADSPQMAMVTVHNEQSIFWPTTNMRRGETARILDELHTKWLKDKYRTHAALEKAWRIAGKPAPFQEGENLDTGVIPLGNVPIWPNGTNDARAMDQKKFLYDVETGFYKRWIDALREWGVKCPIITSNWSGAGNTTRLVLQASTLGEIVDRHNYYTGPKSMLSAVGHGIPMEGFNQQAGRAFAISEWNQMCGGRFAHEAVPLMAVVAAIQGWDALMQYNMGGPTFGLSMNPAHAALYPFASMIWRRGDIATGPLVFERRRDPDHQFGHAPEARVVSADPAARSEGTGGAMPAPPELLAIGRIQNSYADKPAEDFYDKELVERCWDRGEGVVTSAKGDVEWRYKEGWMRLNAPRMQGGFGNLGGRRITCADLRLQSPNDHATVLAASMERTPIAAAKRVVIAAVGRNQASLMNPGSSQPAAGPPILMEPVKGQISLRTDLTRVRALSITGHELGILPAKSHGGWLEFGMTGPPGTMYYLIDQPE